MIDWEIIVFLLKIEGVLFYLLFNYGWVILSSEARKEIKNYYQT